MFIARLLPLARTFVSLPAGARRRPLAPFIVLTTIGCGLWATAFVLLGLLSGTAWSAVSSVLGKALLGVDVIVLLAAIRRRRPRTADDEAGGRRTPDDQAGGRRNRR